MTRRRRNDILRKDGYRSRRWISLIDREDKKVKEHPACYYDREELLIPAIQENPWLLRLPIVRNGNKMTLGYQPDVWAQWE